jgi:hypothetical protein
VSESFILGAFLVCQSAARPAAPLNAVPTPTAKQIDTWGQGIAAELESVAAVADALSVDAVTDWRQFQQLAQGIPSAGSAVHRQIIAWAPRLAASGRTAFENETGRVAYRSFVLKTPRRHEDEPRDESVQSDLFPVLFSAPPSTRSLPLGVDLFEIPAVSDALTGAVASRTARLHILPSANPDTLRFLGVLPVVDETQMQLAGVILVVSEVRAEGGAGALPSCAAIPDRRPRKDGVKLTHGGWDWQISFCENAGL